MTPIEYFAAAGLAWFMGFFPLAEIYVAVPVALGAGLDDASTVFWTVLGNFTPAVLITVLYDWLSGFERVRRLLDRFQSEKARTRINRWGVWFVLLVTPWTGVWVMAVAAKALGMSSVRFMLAAFISISAYAVALVVLIRTGVAVVGA